MAMIQVNKAHPMCKYNNYLTNAYIRIYVAHDVAFNAYNWLTLYITFSTPSVFLCFVVENVTYQMPGINLTCFGKVQNTVHSP